MIKKNSFVSILLALVITLSALQNIVISSPLALVLSNSKDKNENKEEIGIILIQGALIKSEQYDNIAKKIRDTLSDYNTWIAISNSIFNLPISVIGKLAINDCYKELIKQGFNPKSKIFIMGHSLGGEAALDYYIGNKNSLKFNLGGLIMVGSLPQRKIREKTKDLNLLIIGGELDGLSRLTRTAEEFYQRHYNKQGDFLPYENPLNSKSLKFLEEDLNLKESLGSNTSKTAVITLEGLNHMSFCSGNPSSFVASRDLKAEISEEEGHLNISNVINAFIKGDERTLNKYIKETENFIMPLIKAFEYEGSLHFNRPDQTKCHRGYCGEGTEWTKEAQKIISMEKDLNVKLNITNNYVILSSLPPFGDLFHPKMSYNNSTNVMNIATYSQCTWEILDKYVDGGFAPVSAKEIGSKMYSRQCSLVYGAGKKKEDTPIEVDTEGNICASINEAAFNWALENSSKKARERYLKNGQKLKFVDDKYFSNGFSWTYSVLDFSEDKKTGDMNIKSYGMYTTIDAKPLPIFAPDGLACYHYCKTLSPARAAEWIYVDGLRKKYHI